jgi:SAM-dependent methyltransferase
VVTGLDFSGAAIAAARSLAAELGWEQERAQFVQADVYDAPAALDGQRYDIVYTGLGALNWLPDLPRWARTVAALLAPGGFLYLAEFHPVGQCLGPDGAAFTEDYFRREAVVVDAPGTYADPAAQTRDSRSVEWQHTLGEVVSAVAAAGQHGTDPRAPGPRRRCGRSPGRCRVICDGDCRPGGFQDVLGCLGHGHVRHPEHWDRGGVEEVFSLFK